MFVLNREKVQVDSSEKTANSRPQNVLESVESFEIIDSAISPLGFITLINLKSNSITHSNFH